jgi:hypothetical protein
MRKNYTISIDTETWDMLCKLAASLGISRSRVIDMAVLTLHEQSPTGTIPPPQRFIQIGPEEDE